MDLNDTAQLPDEARRLGFEVSRDGDRLHVEGPREKAWFVEKLVHAKPQILDVLSDIGRVRVLVLLPEPYPNEPDNADPAEGRRIVEAVEADGGWISIERGKIVLRWRGGFSGRLIDRIMAARTAVMFAAQRSTREGA